MQRGVCNLDLKISSSSLRGSVRIPASKSMAHRSIICASLSNSECKISNISYSDDIVATIEVMKKIGAVFELHSDYMVVKGVGNRLGSFDKEKIEVNVRESGSTFRFLIPLLAIMNSDVEVYTEGRLIERPMGVYYDILDKNNIDYTVEGRVLKIYKDGEKKSNLKSPRIKTGRFKIRGDISSQFISGLLFTLPLLDGDSIIEVEGELQSKSYVDMTIDCLHRFCVKVDNMDYKKFIIKGNQSYISTDIFVEGDYSQYAFFYVANELGSKVSIFGMEEDSLQGDKKIVEIVEKYKENPNYNFDGSNVVDIVPIISLFASLCGRESKIYNVSRLRMKESDRINAVCDVLGRLGADISSDESSIFINGVEKLKGGVEVSSYGDHRIAMMVGIAGCLCENDIILKDAEVVSKSYPDFWRIYKDLGGKIEEVNKNISNR